MDDVMLFPAQHRAIQQIQHAFMTGCSIQFIAGMRAGKTVMAQEFANRMAPVMPIYWVMSAKEKSAVTYEADSFQQINLDYFELDKMLSKDDIKIDGIYIFDNAAWFPQVIELYQKLRKRTHLILRLSSQGPYLYTECNNNSITHYASSMDWNPIISMDDIVHASKCDPEKAYRDFGLGDSNEIGFMDKLNKLLGK